MPEVSMTHMMVLPVLVIGVEDLETPVAETRAVPTIRVAEARLVATQD
jgi:hypothetical protein